MSTPCIEVALLVWVTSLNSDEIGAVPSTVNVALAGAALVTPCAVCTALAGIVLIRLPFALPMTSTVTTQLVPAGTVALVIEMVCPPAGAVIVGAPQLLLVTFGTNANTKPGGKVSDMFSPVKPGPPVVLGLMICKVKVVSSPTPVPWILLSILPLPFSWNTTIGLNPLEICGGCTLPTKLTFASAGWILVALGSGVPEISVAVTALARMVLVAVPPAIAVEVSAITLKVMVHSGGAAELLKPFSCETCNVSVFPATAKVGTTAPLLVQEVTALSGVANIRPAGKVSTAFRL